MWSAEVTLQNPAAQILSDWSMVPHVSMKVINHTEGCEPGEELLFSNLYGGVYDGFWCNKGRTVSKTNDNHDDCRPIEGMDPTLIDSLFGKKYCGRRAGKPYHLVDRINPITKQCPSGTVPCSPFTSLENTVCYPED